jgi:hypothetical protein
MPQKKAISFKTQSPKYDAFDSQRVLRFGVGRATKESE